MKLRYKRPFFNWLAQLFQKVSGVPPLAMPRAVAGGLKEVTAYGGCALNGIPSEYTELEYIQNNSTSYIDTGYKPNQNTSVEIKIKLNNISGCRFLCAYMTAGALPSFGIGCSSSLKWLNNTNYTLGVTNTDADTSVHTFYKNNNELYLDGNLLDSSGGGADYSIDNNLYLFSTSWKTDSSPYLSTLCNIYYCKIWGGGILVRDFIPVKRNSDNELGMYDRVSQRFFTNQGTGTFIAGNAVTPSPDKPCEIWCNNGKLVPYLNAEGSSTQDGTPGPDNPVEIQDYTQGNMVLRGVGDYKDIYNSSTKTITRKMGVHVFTGEESFVVAGPYTIRTNLPDKLIYNASDPTDCLCNYYPYGVTQEAKVYWIYHQLYYFGTYPEEADLATFRTWVRELYQNGTPIIVYFPLKTETTETWNDVVYTEGTQETITVGNSSATAEMLLKLGDYVDSQDILSGSVARQVGILILKGTEDWVGYMLKSDASDSYMVYSSDYKGQTRDTSIGLCNKFAKSNKTVWQLVGYPNTFVVNTSQQLHLNIDNTLLGITDYTQETRSSLTAKTKAFIQNLYNIGDPIIIIMPLSHTTFESVAPQTLTTVVGTNTLEITQASLAGLELKAEYKRH